MANISTVFIKTNDGFHNEVFMVAEESKFTLCIGTQKTHVITKEEAAEFVKALTSLEVAKKVAKLKIGRKLKFEDSFVNILMNANLESEDIRYTIFRIIPSTRPMNNWEAKVIMQDSIINLPVGCIDDILKYLVSIGVPRAKTFGKFDKIEFVTKLPEVESVYSERDIYVLDKVYDGKPVDSAWQVVNGKWVEFKD